MELVTSISWGANGTFGTCQDGRNTYNEAAEGNDFTGPTLWTSDRTIFGETNPQAVEDLIEVFGRPVDLGSHIDMLHESPQCMGITWDRDNVYWVFDGFNGHIVRYDFAEDHGPGYDDHSDGIISRHIATDVQRVEGVSSHLVLDHDTGLLYVADTGNGRVMVLDTDSGERGAELPAKDCWITGQCADHHRWRGSEWTTFVNGSDVDLQEPSGIDLVDGTLLVGDAATNEILAFDLDGNLVGRAFTGILEMHALGHIEAVSLDEIWFTDTVNDRVYRLQSPVQ